MYVLIVRISSDPYIYCMTMILLIHSQFRKVIMYTHMYGYRHLTKH